MIPCQYAVPSITASLDKPVPGESWSGIEELLRSFGEKPHQRRQQALHQLGDLVVDRVHLGEQKDSRFLF